MAISPSALVVVPSLARQSTFGIPSIGAPSNRQLSIGNLQSPIGNLYFEDSSRRLMSLQARNGHLPISARRLARQSTFGIPSIGPPSNRQLSIGNLQSPIGNLYFEDRSTRFGCAWLGPDSREPFLDEKKSTARGRPISPRWPAAS